jgi:Protein of unknown function (DUF4232)
MSTGMPGSGQRPRTLPLAAAAAAALALAACGSVQAGAGAAAPAGASTAQAGQASSAAGSTSPAAAASSPAAIATCAAAGLKVVLDTAAAGAAAGTYYVPLDFTNTTSKPCQLSGFPDIALTAGAAGAQIGPQAAADHSVSAATVQLAPGGSAHAWLQVADAASFPAGTCHPVMAAGMRVQPPGSRTASYVAHRLPACKAARPSGQILTVHPVQPGRARRGTA